MREIKFRIWDDIRKQMVDVKEIEFNDDGSLYGADVWEPDGSDTYGVEFKWEEAVLLQYTNIKDKNGKEVYEGDIVKLIDVVNEESIGEVIFNEKDASFRVKTIEGKNIDFWGFYQLLSIFMLEIEVIGNIYENPELLEE